MNPCVSVIIPTFNTKKKDLLKSINSVLAQHYHPLELIIVDDGSDVPFSELDEIIFDSRIIWIALDRNQGVSIARNRGISSAKGAYLAFLDADDWWQDDKIEKQVNLIKKTGVRWVYCGGVGHTPEGKIFPIMPRHRGDVFRDLLRSNIITGGCSSVLIAVSVLKKTGCFYEKEDLHEDWDLWVRVAKTEKLDYVSERLFHRNAYDNKSRSNQLEKFSQRKKNFLNRHKEDIVQEGLYEYAWARHYHIMGRNYLMQQQTVKALSNWLKVFPLKPKMFPFHLIPVAVLSFFFPSLVRRMVLWRANRYKRCK